MQGIVQVTHPGYTGVFPFPEAFMRHKRFDANGSGAGSVEREPIAPGCVIYCSGGGAFDHMALVHAIFKNIQHDLEEHPEVKPLFMVPIQKDGDTVAVVMTYRTEG